jgi:hypothetical protein
MPFLKKILLSVFLMSCMSSLSADLLFFGGPEIYHISRWREGGTKQRGRCDGVRAGIERWQPDAIYYSADAFFSEGRLKGQTASGRSLQSELTDFILEGRVGYTFQQTTERRPFITLFGGYGYFYETNDFSYPSPIPFKFTDTFNYVVAGFLSGINLTPLLSIGINFKVRFMMNGESQVTEDPLFEEVNLVMNNETHYRVEIPVSFLLCTPWPNLEASLVPFYEFRHFGGREGFPFDFIDTKFSLVGVRSALAYRF